MDLIFVLRRQNARQFLQKLLNDTQASNYPGNRVKTKRRSAKARDSEDKQADVAQLVEQCFRKASVKGSSPFISFSSISYLMKRPG
jgi:hypothetical protein